MKRKKSLRKTLLITYIFLLFITLIPSIYSVVVFQAHTKQYSQIISNVSTANKISSIAKDDIPSELWNIICGKKEIDSADHNIMLDRIDSGLSRMLLTNKNEESRGILEVATRAYTTLRRNVDMLISQMQRGSPVTQNEATLDEIRTITSLFADIMQDFIVTEIDYANLTNQSLRNTSIILTAIQIIISVLAVIISLNSLVKVGCL